MNALLYSHKNFAKLSSEDFKKPWPLITLARNYFLSVVFWRITFNIIKNLLTGSGDPLVLDFNFVRDSDYQLMIWRDFVIAFAIYEISQEYYVINFIIWGFAGLDRLKVLRLVSTSGSSSIFGGLWTSRKGLLGLSAYDLGMLESSVSSGVSLVEYLFVHYLFSGVFDPCPLLTHMIPYALAFVWRYHSPNMAIAV